MDVGLGDPADATKDEADLDLGPLQLAQRLGQRLERALHIGLDDQVEHRLLAGLDLGEDVLEARTVGHDRCVPGAGGLSVPALAGLRHGLGPTLVGRDHEVVAGLGDVGEPEHLHRGGRAGLR